MTVRTNRVRFWFQASVMELDLELDRSVLRIALRSCGKWVVGGDGDGGHLWAAAGRVGGATKMRAVLAPYERTNCCFIAPCHATH